MIFVTVGTHEQQFNRLIQCVDELKRDGIIEEEVMIQTGFSDYEPKQCIWEKMLPYKDMVKYINEARIVITHGGPSSFFSVLQAGKIPIVCPRHYEFSEHVNDHQVAFCDSVEKRKNNIIVVNDMRELKDTILRYDEIVSTMQCNTKSNNERFCEDFEDIVECLMNQ